jgi:hypothetical protein
MHTLIHTPPHTAKEKQRQCNMSRIPTCKECAILLLYLLCNLKLLLGMFLRDLVSQIHWILLFPEERKPAQSINTASLSTQTNQYRVITHSLANTYKSI